MDHAVRRGASLASILHANHPARQDYFTRWLLGILLAVVATLLFSPANAAKPAGKTPRDTQPPAVAITAPVAGSTVKGLVSVSVGATDNVGVARVDLVVNGVKLASSTTAPYVFSWDSTKIANGAVTLSATAYDAAGKSATASETVSVANTAQPPSVAITSPTPASTVKGTVAVNVSASSALGITRVDLKANGTLVGSSTASPYSFSWNTTTIADGSVILSAWAYDAGGNSATTSSNETVANTTTTTVTTSAPTLSVTAVNSSGGVAIRVYPADKSGLGDGTSSLTRSYASNSRVWLSAALRAGSNYFIKWQKDGVDYDDASTTSVVMDASHTLTAVYETPTCTGVPIYPGVDSLKNTVGSYPAGTTFCLKAGIHRFTASVVARNYDRYIGEPGAILNGSKVVSSFTLMGSYWVASGQTQPQPALSSTIGGYSTCNSDAPSCIYPEKVFFDNRELWQVTSLAALGSGQFYFDYTNNQIYLFDNPTGHTVEVTTGSGGIIGYSTGNYVTVKNLIFEKFGGGDIPGSGNNALKASDGWNVVSNEFRFISLAAVMNSSTGVVRNNYIHHNGEYGVGGGGTFSGNVIAYNNSDGFSPNDGAGGSKFSKMSGLVVRGNTVANNIGRGLWTDYDNVNTTYENNIVENNTEMGIFHEASCAAVIKDNVLRGNNTWKGPSVSLWYGGQILIRESKDVQIYGNDIDATGPAANAISLRDDSVTYTATNCGTVRLQNIAVHNNIIRLDATHDYNGIATATAGYYSTNQLLFSNNIYYLQDVTAGYFKLDATTSATLTKDQWKAAGQDVAATFGQY